MKLNRLGDYLELNDERNANLAFKVENVKGISINKVFIETKANLTNVSLKPYKVVRPKYFSYVTVTSRNGDKVSIAFNDSDETYIVSSSYVSFYVKDENKLLPEYLYLYFNRPEFDRIARFNSWGSARETFSWEDMCNIMIHVPAIEIQKKFLEVYSSLKENAESYEKGLLDLELVSQGYIETLKGKYNEVRIGDFTKERNEKNIVNIRKVLGISKDGFIDPKARPSQNLRNYNMFYKNDFVFSPPRINIGSIALYKDEETAVCSPIYKVFYVDKSDMVIPEYLDLWLSRSEFYRYTDFMSIASVRNNFDYELLSEITIPVPPIKIQRSILAIYELHNERKTITENLHKLLKDISPILIRGAIKESKGVI